MFAREAKPHCADQVSLRNVDLCEPHLISALQRRD
jgi:hypothetical protein